MVFTSKISRKSANRYKRNRLYRGEVYSKHGASVIRRADLQCACDNDSENNRTVIKVSKKCTGWMVRTSAHRNSFVLQIQIYVLKGLAVHVLL